jgi:DNA-binding NarL/FixJ family response regulator
MVEPLEYEMEKMNPTTSSDKPRILIVEDEPLIAEDLAIILRKGGYRIAGIAHDGSQALDILSKGETDVALLDIALSPSMSGFDIAKIINDRYHIPFLFITSFSDRTTLEKAKSLLPEGYITKPFKNKDVLANIEIISYRTSAKDNAPFLSIDELNKDLDLPLSEIEYEVLITLTQGLTNEQIAHTKYVSINTVKTHLKNVYAKLGVRSRTQAMQKVIRL